MTDINKLITDNIDVWSSAHLNANSSGRGASRKRNLIGIKKLRELILELAFSGKLVNSDEREDFEQTLNEIKKQKIEFHSKKGVRVQAFKKLVDEPSNLLVPNNWKVCYLDQVVNYITDFQANGSFATIKKNVTYFESPNYALLVRLTDLRHKLTDDSSYKYTDEHGYNFLSKSSVHGGELVVANVGAGVGTTLLVPKINMPATLAPNMFMIVLPELVNKEYFLYFSQSPQYWSHINKVNTGTGQPKINKTEYKNCNFPLAPRNIQKLVVSKVKELMALCDQLEQQTEASIDAHQLLVEELLSALTNSENAQEFEQKWVRIAEHFDLLFTTEHSIEQLKQTILQLAVMGKLVPQDPSDEPVSELLKRIAKEKEQLINDKIIKKNKKLPDITNEEIEFQIPQSWSITRLGDVANYGSCDKAELTDVDESCWVLELEDVEKVTSKLLKKVRVSDRQFKSSKNRFNSGDVIYGKLRPYLDKVLVADENGVCTTEMIPIRTYYGISSEYLRIVMKTPYFIEYANNSTHGMNLPRMGTDKARLAPIIVAPVNEQGLIVSKVNQLFSVCEELKKAIKISEEVNVELAEALVIKALS